MGALSGCPNPPDPIAYDPPYDSGWLPMSSVQFINVYANTDCGQVCVISATAIKPFTIQLRQVSNPANAVTGTGSLCAKVLNSNDGCVGSNSTPPPDPNDPGTGGGGGGGSGPAGPESPPVEEP